MADEQFDEMPEWVQEVTERVQAVLSFDSVGQIDVRWTEDGGILIAPALFQVESDDEQNGEIGYGLFSVEDAAQLAAILTGEGGRPGQLSCGPWGEDQMVVLSAEGRHGAQDVWLQIQFEPFEDAEPLYVVDLREEDGEARSAGGANGAGE